MKELKIGIIGCGAIGQDHLKRINNEIQGAVVTAVFEINEKVAAGLAKEFQVESFSSGEALIESDLVDAVVIASSDATHERYVLKAIECQKYVLCEKPLTPKAKGGRNIVEAEMAGGKKVLQVGFMRRYDTGYKAMKESLDREDYGQPLMLHCSHRNRQIPGFSTVMAIQNCASHELDICRWLLKDDYSSCEVKLARKNSRHSPEDLIDPQLLILETDGGAVIDIEIFVNCQYGYDINCEAVCEDGIMKLPSPSSVQVKTAGSNLSAISDDWKARFVQAYRDEFQNWVDAVKADCVTGPSAWDGYMVSVATEALIKSLETGEKVIIDKPDCPVFYQ